MIQVSILSHNNIVQKAVLTGHAGYGPKGTDIVCAAASAVFIGALNCLDDSPSSYLMKVEEGFGSIEVLKEISRHDRTVLEVMKRELEDLAETYPDFIQYREEQK